MKCLSPITERTAEHTIAGDLGLELLVRLRWLALAGQIAVFLVAYFVYGFSLSVTPFVALTAFSLCSNLILATALRRELIVKTKKREQAAFCVVLLDTVMLTLLLYFYGGDTNPFSTTYLIQVILAALFLTRVACWCVVIASAIGFGTLFFYHVPVRELADHHGHGMEGTFSLHLQGMYFVFLLTAGLLAYFITRLRHALTMRDSEVAAYRARVSREEKLAALATLAGGAAHELRTPLGSIAVAAHEVERTLLSSDGAQNVAILSDVRLIKDEIMRCEEIIRSMGSGTAEMQGEMPRSLTVGELLTELQREVGQESFAQLVVQAEPEKVLPPLPPRLLTKTIGSLLKNAQDASLEGESVAVVVEEQKTEWRVEVTNQGAVLSPAVLARIGEPFFTTKEPGKGMGLGIFLVKLFAEQIGGTFSFNSSNGRSVASFTIPSVGGVHG